MSIRTNWKRRSHEIVALFKRNLRFASCSCPEILNLLIIPPMFDNKRRPWLTLICGFLGSFLIGIFPNSQSLAADRPTPISKSRQAFQLAWAKDRKICAAALDYANKEKREYLTIAGNFGNIAWVELDHPDRLAVDVPIVFGDPTPRTVFRWITRRGFGLEWDYDLNIYNTIVEHSDLLRQTGPIDTRREFSLHPQEIALPELQGTNFARLLNKCGKKNSSQCSQKLPMWRFSFFDLLQLDDQVYLTASTEKYYTPEDQKRPMVVLIARYLGTRSRPTRQVPPEDILGADTTESICYLIKPN